MKSFIRLTDFTKDELLEIFSIADSIEKYSGYLSGKTVVMFSLILVFGQEFLLKKVSTFLEDNLYYLIQQL